MEWNVSIPRFIRNEKGIHTNLLFKTLQFQLLIYSMHKVYMATSDI